MKGTLKIVNKIAANEKIVKLRIMVYSFLFCSTLSVRLWEKDYTRLRLSFYPGQVDRLNERKRIPSNL
jgi:hypothetical protein